MDKQGKMVIKPQFESDCIFANGIAPVRVGRQCGYIDKIRKMVIQPLYDRDQYALTSSRTTIHISSNGIRHLDKLDCTDL